MEDNNLYNNDNILDKINSALDKFYAVIGSDNSNYDEFIQTVDPAMKPINLQS